MMRDRHKEREKMKIGKILKSAIRKDGKQPLTSQKIVKLKSSKAFNCLVDTGKA
jgi:hypothetical protein